MRARFFVWVGRLKGRWAFWVTARFLLLGVLMVPTLGPSSCPNESTHDTCADNVDNDGDGLFDCDDPECADTDPCQNPGAKVAQVISMFGEQVVIQAHVMGQATIRTLPVSGGCATGSCGFYCGLSSPVVTERCWQNYVVQMPLGWSVNTGSSFWQSCSGAKGGISVAPVSIFSPPPEGPFMPEPGQQILVISTPFVPGFIGRWTIRIHASAAGGANPTDQVKIIPVSHVQSVGPPQLHPFNGWTNFATVPDYYGIDFSNPEGACCLPAVDGNSCFAPIDQINCQSTGGISVPGATCGPGVCQPFGGACMLSFGACILETQERCCDLGGTFSGEGVDCPSTTPCPNGTCDTPSEDCANCPSDCPCGTGTECANGQCLTSNGGSCLSDGQCASGHCAQNTCQSLPVGACCLGDGSCVDGLTQNTCLMSQGGTYQGDGSDCASVVCSPTGACCSSKGCQVLTFAECQNTGTSFAWGQGQSCADFCPGPCCLQEPNPHCVFVPQTSCTAMGGTFVGINATCPPPCQSECEKHGDCGDNDPCNGDERCVDFACASGDAPDCDDGNICTTDSCDPGSGCTHAPVTCEDGNACTVNSCDPHEGCITSDYICGACCDEPHVADCFDSLPGSCQGPGQQFRGLGTRCADLDPPCNGACCIGGAGCVDGRTPDDCSGSAQRFMGMGSTCEAAPCGACCAINVGCIDGVVGDDCPDPAQFLQGQRCETASCGACCNPESLQCTEGTSLALCTGLGHIFLGSGSSCGPITHPCRGACGNDEQCQDQDVCNGTERCIDDMCTAGDTPDCNDSVDCTVDDCDPASGCTHIPDDSLCLDENLCTTNEHCDPAQGCVTDPVVCDDGIGCTRDACDPALGCVHTPDDARCLDENLCTTNERCDPAQRGCVSDPVDCDDGFPCTTDVCVPATGECINAANTAACDDSNPCTIDACAPEHPDRGPDGCVHDAVDCDDGVACTEDSCNPASGECVHTPNDSLCLDENGCTVNERCDAEQGCLSDPKNCADAHDCTTDTCLAPSGDCVHTPVDTQCNDGILCTVDTCDPNIGCLHGAEDSLCNDNIDCTFDDCRPLDPAAGPDGCIRTPDDPVCADGELCTSDRCDPTTGCQHDPRECPDDGDLCTEEFCNSKTGECEVMELCGACCSEDGSACIDVPRSSCVGEAAVFMGVGTSCASNPCRGACCDFGEGCTDDVPAGECEDEFETFMGVGTVCATAPCGACCRTETSFCTDGDTPENCATSNSGIFQGNGTTCTEGLCRGACCLGDGSCTVIEGEDCFGDFRGTGTNCAELSPPCIPFPGGACCLQKDGTCQDGATRHTCIDSLDGMYQGDGTLCASVDCAATGACCITGGCFHTTESGCANYESEFGIATLFLGVGVPCDQDPSFTCPAHGACCRTDGSCVVVRPEDCNGDYRGDNTACDELNPPCEPSQTTGACCDPGVFVAGCHDNVTAAECTQISNNAVFIGVGTTCAAAPCGACCDPFNSACVDFDTRPVCESGGGVYQGDGSSCSPDPCRGACCRPDGTCTVTEGENCPGDFRGTGTACDELNPPCAAFIAGACCLDDGSCLDGVSQNTCVLSLFGTYQGDGSTCANVNCSATGACCFDDGECSQTTEAGCASLEAVSGENTTFLGVGTPCAGAIGNQCPAHGACCRADGTCVVVLEGNCNGDYRGDGTACDELNPPCQPSTTRGACCDPFRGCYDNLTAEECVQIDDDAVFIGPGTTCTGAPCGACCDPWDSTCGEFFTRTVCEQSEGIYQGDGSTCEPNPCLGACCLPDGSCAVTLGQECDGDFRGNGTACDELNPPCTPFTGGACCLQDGNCAGGVTPNTCVLSMSGTHQGDGSTCAEVDCSQTGACCFDDGFCMQTTEAGCASLEAVSGENTTFLGVGTSCAGNFADECPTTGACCRPSVGCLDGVAPDACTGMDTFMGAGTTCATAPCGACCDTDSSDCTNGQTQTQCEGAGMIFQGPGSTCAEHPCRGACCLPDGTCAVTSAEECGGQFRGNGTDCAEIDPPCPVPPSGACCFQGSCIDGTTPESCTFQPGSTFFGPFGSYQGDGTMCATTDCQATGACCYTIGGESGETSSGCGQLTRAACEALPTVVLALFGSNAPVQTIFLGEGVPCEGPDGNQCPGGGGVGACCRPDGTCVVTTHGQCPGDFRGEGTACDELNPPCAPYPTGACCLGDGSCIDGTTPESCTFQPGFGSYQGDGTMCATTDCQATGACCYTIGGESGETSSGCGQLTRAACEALPTVVLALFGSNAQVQTTFLGEGVLCEGPDGDQCPQGIATGACCLSDGSCVVRRPVDCFGDYRGDGTSCAEINPPCLPDVGACCVEGQGCIPETTEAECVGAGGTWLGEGELCETSGCGACCNNAQAACADGVFQADCIVAGGNFKGSGTQCVSVTCCTSDADCDDTLFCNGGEACVGGLCVLGEAPCNPATHFCNEVEDTCQQLCSTDADCDDLQFCNGTEQCIASVCFEGDDPCVPPLACDEIADRCRMPCVTDFDCMDGDPCTTDRCGPTFFCGNVPIECKDSIDCTADVCDANGKCQFVPSSALCDDGVDCTEDICDPSAGCLYAPNDANCDDGNACTNNVCHPAAGCLAPTPVDCNDNNACTSDACDPAAGCTNTAINCGDNDGCTNDSCDPAVGCVYTMVDCNDNNACTVDICHPATGCSNDLINCNDGDACTADSCDPAIGCRNFPVVCNDGNSCTDDACVNPLGCAFVPNSDACDDHDACTTNDVCHGGVCHGGSPPDCDDHDACTTDSCDPIMGCRHDPLCPNGQRCNRRTGACECPVLCGDLDFDGDVDLDDLHLFLASFGFAEGDPEYNVCADYDGNGIVNVVDLRRWRRCLLNSLWGRPALNRLGLKG